MNKSDLAFGFSHAVMSLVAEDTSGPVRNTKSQVQTPGAIFTSSTSPVLFLDRSFGALTRVSVSLLWSLLHTSKCEHRPQQRPGSTAAPLKRSRSIPCSHSNKHHLLRSLQARFKALRLSWTQMQKMCICWPPHRFQAIVLRRLSQCDPTGIATVLENAGI